MGSPDDTDEFISALTSLLKTILRMRGLPETDLHIPDADGGDLHPNHSAVMATKKAPEVVELLRRMPHVTHKYDIYLAPHTPMMNYWIEPSKGIRPYQSWHPDLAEDGDEEDLPAIVEATELPFVGDGGSENDTIILDLSGPQLTARIYEPENVCVMYHSGIDCPRPCPHNSGMRCLPAAQLLRDYEQEWLAANYVPDISQPGTLVLKYIDPGSQADRMRIAFLACGWPGQDYDAAKAHEMMSTKCFKHGRSCLFKE